MTFVKHALLTIASLALLLCLTWCGREAIRIYQKTEHVYQQSLKVEVLLQHLAGPILVKYDDKGQPLYLVGPDGQPITRLHLLERLLTQQ